MSSSGWACPPVSLADHLTLSRYQGNAFTGSAYNSWRTAAPCEEMRPYGHMHEGNDICI